MVNVTPTKQAHLDFTLDFLDKRFPTRDWRKLSIGSSYGNRLLFRTWSIIFISEIGLALIALIKIGQKSKEKMPSYGGFRRSSEAGRTSFGLGWRTDGNHRCNFEFEFPLIPFSIAFFRLIFKKITTKWARVVNQTTNEARGNSRPTTWFPQLDCISPQVGIARFFSDLFRITTKFWDAVGTERFCLQAFQCQNWILT